ncbi:MAG: chalcone isomerase family protein [Acidobacteriota bacterium]
MMPTATSMASSDSPPAGGAASAPFAAQPAASGRTFEGVRFTTGYQLSDGLDLELRSLGLLRYKGLLRGFAAGLYLESGLATSKALDDVAKRLELSYFVPIPGRLFGPAGKGALKKGLSRAGFAEVEDRVRQIDRAYVDVKAGDRYSLTYRPGEGTELAHNGRQLTVVDGADFAAAYFAIWLGPSSIDRKLRRQLLA